MQIAARAHKTSSPIPKVQESLCLLPAAQPGNRLHSHFLSCTTQSPLGQAEQLEDVAEHTLKSRMNPLSILL